MSMDFTRAEDYFRDQPGFKLDHTHFRIGSKYHSDTFLYAKGLFQNSFYASRIGMIIANLIKLKCEEPDNKNIDSITIVSYERYSELLLGIIRNLLKSMMPSLEVLLCVMVEKEGEMVPISYVQPQSENYFVIVPIVSTGSTSERLKASFNKKVFGKKINVRMREGFFPFTEPGYEIDMECLVCGGKGCKVCNHNGWIEVMPGGVIHLVQHNIQGKYVTLSLLFSEAG